MIVRDKPTAWQPPFMRGSIVPATAPRLAVVTRLSILVVVPQDARPFRPCTCWSGVSSRSRRAGRGRADQGDAPYACSLILHRTAYLFCLLLPIGLGSTVGRWTPVLVAIVSYTVFGLDALGNALEVPFGTGQNALPLSAMTLGIAIDIREMLGEVDLPDAAQPLNYVLT